MFKLKLKYRLFGLCLLLLLAASIVLFFAVTKHINKQIRVERVIDGDTVLLSNGKRVRYIGIDTPEKSAPFYEQAKKLNRELVEGKNVVLEFDVETLDKYGRLLAYVYADKIFVNAELLKKGVALVYTYPPNVKYASYFVELQKKARQEGVGIWSLPLTGKEKYYIASVKSRRFHRPSCSQAERISSENLIKFSSREEALDLGYSPCRICQP